MQIRKTTLLLLCLAAAFGFSVNTEAQSCEDFVCECGSGETHDSCPSDCGFCGDLQCDPNETRESCPEDCGPCGDLKCEGGERHANCPDDCPSLCGDLVCDPEESNCPGDCEEGVIACEGTATPCPDGDQDGVCDTQDNCPSTANPDQLDGNHNGIGDACEKNPPLGGGGGCSLNPDL